MTLNRYQDRSGARFVTLNAAGSFWGSQDGYPDGQRAPKERQKEPKGAKRGLKWANGNHSSCRNGRSQGPGTLRRQDLEPLQGLDLRSPRRPRPKHYYRYIAFQTCFSKLLIAISTRSLPFMDGNLDSCPADACPKNNPTCSLMTLRLLSVRLTWIGG